MSPADLLLRPAALPLLLLAPAAWLGLRALDRARHRRTEALTGPRLALLAPGAAGRRRAAGTAVFAGAALLALAALLEPAWGGDGALEARGTDVVLCLDVSRSMLATDAAPTRLGRARAEIRALAAGSPGDRLALVAFAGEARLLVPLTRDGGTVAAVADGADPLSVPLGGSDPAAALDAALRALDAGRGDAAAIVVLTDGGDAGEGALRAAERCGARGVPVHCVGIGSLRGSGIPVEGPGGPEFLRDREGREVLTALAPGALRAMAAASGGTFVESGEGAPVLPRIRAGRLVPDARRAVAASGRGGRTRRFQAPLLAAVLLWMIGSCWIDPRS